MLEMNVGDREFARLLARWVFQSEYITGKSGGRTHFDSEYRKAPKDPQAASFIPFPEQPWFSSFTKEWEKQDHFKYAKPLLAILFTAMSAKYGKGWAVYANAAKSWYRLGVDTAAFYDSAIEKLVAMDKPLILYGRDCLPLYRGLIGRVSKLAYAEGMSRPIVRPGAYSSGQSQEQVRTFLLDLMASQFGGQFGTKSSEAVKQVVHVDTGFSGTIPRECHLAVAGVGPGADNVRMLTSEGGNFPQWNLGLLRLKTTKFEYVPKMFYRPTQWVERDVASTPLTKTAKVPKLLVSGDAINAAALIVGVMAATAKKRYAASKQAR